MKTHLRTKSSHWSKFIFTFLFAFFISSLSYSQKKIEKYSLSGIIVDSETSRGLEGANIIFSSRLDSAFISGVSTDSTGYFIDENITESVVRIKISMIGYQTKIIDSLSLKSTSNTGIIRLIIGGINMPEIVVKSIKPMIEFHADKHVVNIDKVPGSTGSLREVLNNTGEVEIDPATNAISIRGEAVKIQMDGHNSNMPTDMLVQMPASMFEQAEIILSPSAKESAEGGVYILNLVSKKTILDNLNASIFLNTGTNNRNYGGLNFNYKNGKINVFSSLFGYKGEYKSIATYEQLNYNSSSLYHQSNSSENNSNSNSIYWKFGLDYEFSENDFLTMYGTLSNYDGESTNKSENIVLDNSNAKLYGYSNNSDSKNEYKSKSLYTFYKKKFEKKGNELTLDAMYTTLKSPSYIDRGIIYSYKEDELHKDDTRNDSETLILKLEYKYPSDIGEFETGYNYTYRDRENELAAQDYSPDSGNWIDGMNLSNLFKYNEEIHAYYLTYANKYGDLSLKTGVRIENLITKGDQVTTGEKFSKDYLSVFPNLNLSYKFDNTFQLTINMFRRVRYPHLYYVNPFKRYYGPNKYSIGNPELRPYFLNSFGINLSQFINAYYVFSNGLFYSSTSVVDDSVTVDKYINLSKNKTYGIELTLPYYNSPNMFFHLPDFVTNLRLRYSYNYRKQTGEYLNENLSYSGTYQWFRASLGLKLWWDLNLFLSYRYNPKIETVRFKRQDESYMSLYLSKSFFENKLRISLSIRDLFESQKYHSETFGTEFYSKSTSEQINSRSISIGISYIFNDYRERRDRNIDDGREANENSNF